MRLKGLFSLRHRLAEERTERTLRTVVRGSAYLCLIGTLLVGYSLWSIHHALAHEQSAHNIRSKQMAQIVAALKDTPEGKRQADALQTALPQERGSMEFAAEVSHQAQLSDVRVTEMRLSDGSDTTTAAPSGSSAPASTEEKGTTEDAPQEEPIAIEWQGAPFELNVSGSFRNLSAFLDRMAALPRVVELGEMTLSRSGLAPSGKEARLQMKVTGQFFGLPSDSVGNPTVRPQGAENTSKRP